MGYYFIIRISQDSVKEEMKEKALGNMPVSEMEIISLSDNQEKISWEENGKEFLLNGEMYDVVKSVKENGHILLYCLNDVKEKQVIEKYNEITSHNSTSGKKEGNNNYNSINLFLEVKSDRNTSYCSMVKNVYPTFVSRLQSVSPKNYSPPPEA